MRPAELARGIELRRFGPEVLEVELVQPHAVELPAQAPLQLGIFQRAGLAVLGHGVEGVEDLVGVGDVTLVEREVVLQQLTEPGRSKEPGIVFGV